MHLPHTHSSAPAYSPHCTPREPCSCPSAAACLPITPPRCSHCPAPASCSPAQAGSGPASPASAGLRSHALTTPTAQRQVRTLGQRAVAHRQSLQSGQVCASRPPRTLTRQLQLRQLLAHVLLEHQLCQLRHVYPSHHTALSTRHLQRLQRRRRRTAHHHRLQMRQIYTHTPFRRVPLKLRDKKVP